MPRRPGDDLPPTPGTGEELLLTPEEAWPILAQDDDAPLYELVEAILTGKIHVRQEGAEAPLCGRGSRMGLEFVETLLQDDIAGHYGPHLCRACEKKFLALVSRKETSS